MNWSDDGIVLAARKHGETSLIVSLLTRAHGRHAGLVRGGAGRRARGVYQPGNRVTARWRARLAEHLGSFTCELEDGVAARLLDDRRSLAGLAAACALAEAALPERQPHAAVHDGLRGLLDALVAAESGSAQWAEAYLRWELGLLGELGFGLDLSCCAATGRNDGLAWVSPRTGRAVSLSAGQPYADRLLPLPPFLLAPPGTGMPDPAALSDGFALTGYFLDRHVFAAHHRPMPPARARLVGVLGLG